MFEHRQADRVPIVDSPWPATLERWQREGMPEGVSFVDFFGLDQVGHISVDNSPRYEVKTLDETDEYVVQTSAWGATLKTWKHAASTPEFRAFTIVDRPSWEKAKARMTPTRDRVNWDRLKANYPLWKEKGAWIEAGLWFGFDVAHAWAVGTERLLMALVEDPEWIKDMFNTYLDVNLALLEMVWDAGYHFDTVQWPDDMGYKYHQFFSVATYRDVLKPVHKRAIDWAHARGIKAHLHSCGDINPIVPELVSIGLDTLEPLEVKAGMDPIHLKKTFGDKLALKGGINAMLWDKIDAIEAVIRKTLPVMKEGGGYIFASDHSVPSSVSLENFRRIVQIAKEEGQY
jgi:uroporphyrinogen decarboxylase